jgi:hypothetical protein
MIFRWSMYGDAINNIELLQYSIESFRKHFGNDHKYIVYTDNQDAVAEKVNAEVRQIYKDSLFYIKSEAPWMKWYPTARLSITQTEFYIDYDVFLVKYPKEIDEFLANPKLKFAILDEFKGKRWQHGIMYKFAPAGTPYINSGFFIQKAGQDISYDFIQQLKWWKENIKPQEHTHHDEQGCLAIALTKHLNELYVLPKDKYMLIGKTENSHLTD